MRRPGTLLLLCLLPACNDVLGIGQPVPRELDGPAAGGAASGGSGGAGAAPATGGTSSTGGAGGSTLATTSSGAGAGGAGGSGGGEPQLPCDPGFEFSAKPITTSSIVAKFTGPDPWVYVALKVNGPGATDVSTFTVVGNGPYTWSWTVNITGSGLLTFTFLKNKNGNNPGEAVGTCQVEAIL